MNKKKFSTPLQPETIEKLERLKKLKGLSKGYLIDLAIKKLKVS